MSNNPHEGPTLFGIVEVDETLVDSKVKSKGRRYTRNKMWLAGAIQREGKIRVEFLPDIKKRTLHNFIARAVKGEAEAISTDELRSYLVQTVTPAMGRSIITNQ